MPLSVTIAMNWDDPEVWGVPEITPAVDKVSPAGRLPDLIDHVYGGVPPLACNGAE